MASDDSVFHIYLPTSQVLSHQLFIFHTNKQTFKQSINQSTTPIKSHSQQKNSHKAYPYQRVIIPSQSLSSIPKSWLPHNPTTPSRFQSTHQTHPPPPPAACPPRNNNNNHPLPPSAPVRTLNSPPVSPHPSPPPPRNQLQRRNAAPRSGSPHHTNAPKVSITKSTSAP